MIYRPHVHPPLRPISLCPLPAALSAAHFQMLSVTTLSIFMIAALRPFALIVAIYRLESRIVSSPEHLNKIFKKTAHVQLKNKFPTTVAYKKDKIT